MAASLAIKELWNGYEDGRFVGIGGGGGAAAAAAWDGTEWRLKLWLLLLRLGCFRKKLGGRIDVVEGSAVEYATVFAAACRAHCCYCPCPQRQRRLLPLPPTTYGI